MTERSTEAMPTMFLLKLLRQLPLYLVLILGLGAARPALSAPALMCMHLPQLLGAYLKQHYQHHTLTPELQSRTIEQFIKDSDSSKSTFYESDVAKIRQDLAGLFDSMKKGNCSSLESTTKLILQRTEQNEKYVKSYLDAKYKLDKTAQLQLDPKKRQFPKDQKQREDLLRRMVHFQIASSLLADLKLEEAKKQLIHRYELVSKRVRERKPEDVFSLFLESFALSLDPHSSFLSRDNMEDFQIQMQLSLEGIGASLSSQDGFTVIEELIPGGGAEKTKMLEPKDKIMAVAQDKSDPVSTIDMDLRDVVKMIRGKKGTKVTLTILRQAEHTKTFNVTIVRDKIDMKEQAAKLTLERRTVDGKKLKIGVLDLPSFYGGNDKKSRLSSVDTRKLLQRANKQKVDALVLNLSRNGGGLLPEAVAISGLFLNEANVVATKDTNASTQILSDDDHGIAYAGPLVVLTSRLSASASEILAGSLRDYKRAVIVGADHTFGKGSVQTVTPLPFNLGGMKVTIGLFFIPGGKSTQLVGVPGDVVLPPVFNTKDIGERTLDYALPAQSMEPFTSSGANTQALLKGKPNPAHWTLVEPAVVKALEAKSKIRTVKNAKFIEAAQKIAEAQKNEGVVTIAEFMKRSQEKTSKNDKKRSRLSLRKAAEFDAPLLDESINVAADLAVASSALASK